VGRRELELNITQKFKDAFGAELSQFLPHLMRLNASDELGAVVGIRPAHSNQLFLEQYLDRRVEQAIAAAYRVPVDRSQVVEIGNLASRIPGLAQSLFVALANVLHEAGCRWVACTVTPQVAAMLQHLGFASRTICDADPDRLQADSGTWGDYYSMRPQVICGDIRAAAAIASRNSDAAMMLRQYAKPIQDIAAVLRQSA
jgi:hypothetical protein